MNEQTPTRPAIGTKVRFAADFRINEGVIESYTPTGRAVVVVEDRKQYTLTLDQLIMLGTKAMNPQQNSQLTPVFELDENVLVNLANMPAKVVMLGSDGQTVNVVFGDGYEAHTVPVASVTRLAAPSPFKIGDPVEVGQVGVPAQVVGISADGSTVNAKRKVLKNAGIKIPRCWG
ncbi:MAG: hypothetical protein HY862_03645 [Chloroflexi bacterium]|nr:hypothetical protein [Chloroflexota bacterium]